MYKLILVVVSVLLMSGCGYDPSIDNHGYGYEYDYSTDLDIKVINDTPDADIDEWTIDYIARYTFECVTNNEQLDVEFESFIWNDFYIVLTNSIEGGNADGRMHYIPKLMEVLSYTGGTTHSLTYTMRHEFVHYYVYELRGMRDSQHNLSVFNNCVY